MDLAFPEPPPRLSRAPRCSSATSTTSAGWPLPHEAIQLPSGWTPVELLLHLRHVERRWLEWGFLGVDVGDPWADERDGRWHVPVGVGPVEVIAQLRRQGARTREIVSLHGLDEQGRPGPRWNGAKPATLERVLFHAREDGSPPRCIQATRSGGKAGVGRNRCGLGRRVLPCVSAQSFAFCS